MLVSLLCNKRQVERKLLFYIQHTSQKLIGSFGKQVKADIFAITSGNSEFKDYQSRPWLTE